MSIRSLHPQAALVVAMGFGQIVAFASGFYLMGVLGDPIARDLGLSTTFVFGTVSLSLAVPALLARRVARRIDATGGKPVLLASSVAFAAGLVIMGMASGPSSLTAGMAVIGLGMALGLSPTPCAILVSLYGEAARRPITGVALVGGLGSALGWPLSGWLVESFGWRGACLGWAAIHLAVCLPLAALILPHTHRNRPAAVLATAPAAAKIRWDPPMVQLAVLFACAWFISTCMSAHLPRLLQAFGLSIHAATGAAALVGVAAVSVRFLEFTVLRNLDPLATTRVATLTHPAGAIALLGLGGAGAPAMALGQGAGNGMLTVAKGVLPLRLYGPDNYAYRSAMLTQPATLAQVAGPITYGLLLERSPVLALLVSSGLCLVMFAMTFGIARARSPKPEPIAA